MVSNDRIQIRISDDGLEAWAIVGKGPPLHRSALEDRLEAAGITTGIRIDGVAAVVRALTLESAMLEDRCVARGLPAQPGTPPVLQLNDPAGLIPGMLLEDGRIDFRERLLILPIAKGELMGRIIPAIEGKPGSDVQGEPIEPPALAELSIRHGEGISIGEDGILVATRSGARTFDPDGTLDVVAHYVHPGNVDLKSGNLHTKGSLEVLRDVTTGMSVRAESDIKIAGTVDGGRVYAGGSVEIINGIIGRESGAVHAGGDLTVGHALGARLHAQNRLVVSRSVSTSHLVAKEIKVIGKMLGNSVQAETRIVLEDAGSAAGGPCVLRAAYPLETDPHSLRPRQSQTDVPTKKMLRDVTSLRARKGRNGRKGRAARPSTKRQLEIDARREWRCRQRELQRTAVIEIRGTAHAGCRLDFGGAPLVLERDVRAKRFQVDPNTQKIITTEI